MGEGPEETFKDIQWPTGTGKDASDFPAGTVDQDLAEGSSGAQVQIPGPWEADSMRWSN